MAPVEQGMGQTCQERCQSRGITNAPTQAPNKLIWMFLYRARKKMSFIFPPARRCVTEYEPKCKHKGNTVNTVSKKLNINVSSYFPNASAPNKIVIKK